MSQRIIVETRAGKVGGAKQCNFEGGEFYAFRGIPYAKPPVGELRFQDPQPVEPWTDVREAIFHGQNCAQPDFITNKVIGDDDCLYLNVYTKSMKLDKKLPVMFWIHGGGFVQGSGDDSIYGPEYFMRKDLVLVTINYRLGVLGFLNLNDEVATGNQGLKDQVMALKWVRDNVARFGGDPRNVTIFGESAGGASVHYLCLSPLAKSLFHKAIAQSGSVLNPWAFQPNPQEKAYQLCKLLGHEGKHPQLAVEFLRTVTIQKLIDAQEKLRTKKEKIQLSFNFWPSIDSKYLNPFIPVHPDELSKQGVNVLLIIGYCNREGIIVLIELAKAYRRFNNECGHHGIVVSTESGKFEENVFTKQRSACHADEIFYLFPLQRFPTMTQQYIVPQKSWYQMAKWRVISLALTCLLKCRFNIPKKGFVEYRISEQMIEMWMNFAVTGQPTTESSELIAVNWQPVDDTKHFCYLNIREILSTEVEHNLELKYNVRKNLEN